MMCCVQPLIYCDLPDQNKAVTEDDWLNEWTFMPVLLKLVNRSGRDSSPITVKLHDT